MAIHPTAIIDSKAELDPTVEVGPYCVIDAHVRVGAGTRLYQGVYLTGWTEIGEACVLHPGVIVGHEPQDTKYNGERTYCRVGRGTILREYVTIHRGTIPESETVVGEECFLLGNAHVAHNCVLGNRVTMINSSVLGGHVEIQDNATLGGCAGVHQFVRIGELAMVPGGVQVRMDLVPFAMADLHGRVAGLNRVGLKRAGMTADQIGHIREAYRRLIGRGSPPSLLDERTVCDLRSPEVDRLVHFLRSESRRGVAGRSRSGPGHPPSDTESDPR